MRNKLQDIKLHNQTDMGMVPKKGYLCAFPPFFMIVKVLKKVREDGSTGIFFVLFWTSQPWFLEFKRLIIPNTIILEPSEELLNSACRKVIYALLSTLTLVSEVFCEGCSSKRTYRMTL